MMENKFHRYRKKEPIWAVQLPVGVKIDTLEGEMEASEGDYLAIGVEGEIYPIKEPIFHKTYERVSDGGDCE